MNPVLRMPKIGLIIFFIGLSIGFFLTLLLPEIGTANYVFQMNQANWLKTFYTGKEVDTYFISLMIFIRNFMIASLFTVSPLVLIQYILKYRIKHQFESEHMHKLGNEISRLLTLYSLSVLFIYGFFVYGLFFGFILIQKSVYGLTQLLIYLIPHGILETHPELLIFDAALLSASYGDREYFLENQNRIQKMYFLMIDKVLLHNLLLSEISKIGKDLKL